MAATNINRIVMTGNLTKDPELRSLPSGTSVCELRIACNTRRKDQASGEWTDKPNYFNVKVWGAQGENAARYLSKGRPVAIDGRLEWREWEAQDGTKRQAIDIIADSVQFLGSREDSSGGGAFAGNGASQGGETPVNEGDFQPAPVGAAAGDEDIPFYDSASEPSGGQQHQHCPRSRRGRQEVEPVAKARGRSKPARRREKRGGPGSGRRKPCQHCRDKIEQVDYKDVATLRRFVSEKGKIRSRRITGACRRHQAQVARAVKRARELALLPYVNEGGRDDNPRRERGDRDRGR